MLKKNRETRHDVKICITMTQTTIRLKTNIPVTGLLRTQNSIAARLIIPLDILCITKLQTDG